MKREEVIALFPDATKEQIDSLMSINGVDINTAKATAVTDKEEIARLKGIETDYKTLVGQNQTAEEKLQAALDAAELAKKEYAVKGNRLEVEKVLVGAGLTDEDYKDIIDSMVSDNAETSLKLATGFTTILKAKKDATEREVKAGLLNGTPLPNGGTDGTPPTKTEAEKLVESLVSTRTEANKASQSTLDYYTNGGNK